MPGRELADLPEDRQRRGDRIEREERLQGVGVDLAAGQGAQLGGEGKLAVDRAVVQRLDSEAVACEHQTSPPCVPDRDCEHAPQTVDEPVAVLLVEVQQDLRIAVGAEAMAPFPLEVAPQFAVVVDLAVLDDVERPVLIRDRLIARLEIDDREPPRRERDLSVAEFAEAVRAAMDERGAHRRDAVGDRRAVCRGDSADPAHGRSV